MLFLFAKCLSKNFFFLKAGHYLSAHHAQESEASNCLTGEEMSPQGLGNLQKIKDDSQDHAGCYANRLLFFPGKGQNHTPHSGSPVPVSSF